jgi:hypothetical protein
MRITKSISLPEWHDEVKQKVIDFWQERRVTFSETAGDTLRGRRGSLWGNLFSFDESRLAADLTISRTGEANIECVLNVDTRYQDIVEWSEAYWRLEMDTLETYLLRGDQREQEWQQFREDARAAAWKWVLSCTLLGRNMPRRP